ncbi:MAG: DUF4834 family protein [Bacteroidia bacterium]|jgi:hypothetical protein|nr:DUF4834 family protein [Bacteroidia bacterium]
MEGFLTFVIVFVVIIWIARRLFPFLLIRWVRKKMGGAADPFQRATGQSRGERFKEGDVIIESGKSEKKIVDDNIGEYIDFEETKTK